MAWLPPIILSLPSSSHNPSFSTIRGGSGHSATTCTPSFPHPPHSRTFTPPADDVRSDPAAVVSSSSVSNIHTPSSSPSQLQSLKVSFALNGEYALLWRWVSSSSLPSPLMLPTLSSARSEVLTNFHLVSKSIAFAFPPELGVSYRISTSAGLFWSFATKWPSLSSAKIDNHPREAGVLPRVVVKSAYGEGWVWVGGVSIRVSPRNCFKDPEARWLGRSERESIYFRKGNPVVLSGVVISYRSRKLAGSRKVNINKREGKAIEDEQCSVTQ